jgi:O-antigen/teichoic acid export membrane protein
VARNAASRGVGEVVAKLASVAFFVVMARELGEVGFGDFMFALSFASLLLLAAGFGTEELVAREVARDRSRVHEYLSNVLAVKVGTSIVLLGLAIAFVELAGYPYDARIAVCLVGAGVAVENLGRTLGSVFQATERMELLSISLIVQRVATAGVGIAVLLSGGGILEVSLIFLGGSLLGFAVASVVLLRYVVRPRMAVDRARWWPIVRAGAPIGLAIMVLTVLLKLDQVLLSLLEGGEHHEVGFYAAAFRLVEATMFISWSFAAAFLPWVAHRGAEESERLGNGYELALKGLSAVLVPIGVLFVVAAQPLIDLLYGVDYEPAIEPVRWLGVTTVFYGLNLMAATLLVARDRPLDFALICAAVVVLNVALNLVLIPPLGATGAAIAAAASSVALALLGAIRISALTGRLRVLRPFAGPVAGGAAMAATMLAMPLPLVPDALLGAAVYALAFLLVESRLFPDDLAMARGLLVR